MASEYTPGWSRPRMTQVQIKKLQREQEEARKIAEQKIADAKTSDEWKKDQKALQKLEAGLENGTIIEAPVWPWEPVIIEDIEEKELTFWEEIKLFIKTMYAGLKNLFKK